jgi:hypothetical protein
MDEPGVYPRVWCTHLEHVLEDLGLGLLDVSDGLAHAQPRRQVKARLRPREHPRDRAEGLDPPRAALGGTGPCRERRTRRRGVGG